MLGLGETEEEVIQTMKDLSSVNWMLLPLVNTYNLQKSICPVKEFITPEQFKKYETIRS